MQHTHSSTHETSRYSKGGCLSLIVICLGVVVLVGFAYTSLGMTCAAEAQAALPDYPRATFIAQETNLLWDWGVGETRRILLTHDDVFTVRRWYRSQPDSPDVAAQPVARSRALVAWSARSTTDGGTRIILASACGQRLSQGWNQWDQ